MDQLRCFGDERVLAWCAYCGGGDTSTRDHVPSRVLLDEPYPANLPVVDACRPCNDRFSIDEEYLACLVDCTLAGSTRAENMARSKVRRILVAKPALAARLAAAQSIVDGVPHFLAETDRVRNVVLKLARGHAAFELHEPRVAEPTEIWFTPFGTMSALQRERFESPSENGTLAIWPEVGSRAMQRLAAHEESWLEVQPGRYRYLTMVEPGAISLRFVLSEYLACQVMWAD